MEELIKSVQNDPILKAKLQMLALATELGSITLACQKAGFSRDTFYRVKRRFDEAGMQGLVHKSKGKANPKARIPQEVEIKVIEFATENPGYGKLKLSRLLKAKGIDISAAGVKIVLERNGLWESERRAELVLALAKKVGSIFG